MKEILNKIDFSEYSVYEININIKDSTILDNADDNKVDENGQSMDSVSLARRTVKYSFPFDNKKIINTIEIGDEVEEEGTGDLCRSIALHYYIVVEKQEVEEFDTEELHDVLEEEWRDGSSGCDIKITLLEDLT